MSRRRYPGDDKYYTQANCARCGGWTGVDYAYRFGGDEPTVYCVPCEYAREREKRRCHTKRVVCERCYDTIRMKDYESDSDNEYELCDYCEDAKYDSLDDLNDFRTPSDDFRWGETTEEKLADEKSEVDRRPVVKAVTTKVDETTPNFECIASLPLDLPQNNDVTLDLGSGSSGEILKFDRYDGVSYFEVDQSDKKASNQEIIDKQFIFD